MLATSSLAPGSDAAGSHAEPVCDEPHRYLVDPLVSFSQAEMRAFFARHFDATLEVVHATDAVMHLRRVAHSLTQPPQQQLQLVVVMFASPSRMPYACFGRGTWSFASLAQLQSILFRGLLACDR